MPIIDPFFSLEEAELHDALVSDALSDLPEPTSGAVREDLFVTWVWKTDVGFVALTSQVFKDP